MSTQLTIFTGEKALQNDFSAYDAIKDKHQKWNLLVISGKELLKFEEKCQMAIAELAIRACDIEWTLGEKTAAYKEKKARLTQVKFARSIGMKSAKKLQEWIAIKRRVWDYIDEGDRKKLKMRDATFAARELNKRYKDTPWKKPDKKEVIEVYNKHAGLKEHKIYKFRADGVYYFRKTINLLVTQRLYLELDATQREIVDGFITRLLEVKAEYNQIKALEKKYVRRTITKKKNLSETPT